MGVTRALALVILILTAAASRLLPHPPNFTSIGAIALFGGATFGDRRLAFLVPLAAMGLSDLVIGVHRLLPVVYGVFALIVLIGLRLRRRRTPQTVFGAALAASVLFFLITNFAVWATGTMYPHTPGGLLAAYLAAIPFFRNSLMGDLFYAAVLFGGWALLERRVAGVRDPSSPTAHQA